jgi:hypothetical protein
MARPIRAHFTFDFHTPTGRKFVSKMKTWTLTNGVMLIGLFLCSCVTEAKRAELEQAENLRLQRYTDDAEAKEIAAVPNLDGTELLFKFASSNFRGYERKAKLAQATMEEIKRRNYFSEEQWREILDQQITIGTPLEVLYAIEGRPLKSMISANQQGEVYTCIYTLRDKNTGHWLDGHIAYYVRGQKVIGWYQE